MYYSQINYDSFKNIESLSNTPQVEQKKNIDILETSTKELPKENIKQCMCKQNTVLEFVSFLTFGTFVILLVNLRR